MRTGIKAVLCVIISALILSWGTTGGTAAFAASPSAQPTSFKFRTPFAPSMGYSQFYVAQELYWPKLNLEGIVLPGKGSAVALQSVASGSEQMGYSALVSLMNGIQQGMPVKIIAVIQRRDPTALIFMKDSGIRELKDLVGKRVGNYSGGSTGPLFRAALQQNGIDEQKVRMVNIPPGGEVQLLLEKKIDAVVAFFGGEDMRLRCMGYEATSIPLATFGLNFYGQAVFVNTKWADQAGDDVVARALFGIIQGSITVKQDMEQAIKIVHKLNPGIQYDRSYLWAQQQTLARWSWNVESTVLNKQGFGWVDEAEMAKTQKVLVESGLLQKEIEVGDYYTNKYLKDPRVNQAAMEMVRSPWPEAPDDVKKKCGL